MLDSISAEAKAVLEAVFVEEIESVVNSRKPLEHIWRSARNQYKGKDEDSMSISPYDKGETLDSITVRRKSDSNNNRSTVVPNITRPYTNAGTARVADILLPTNKLPFAYKATPVSDLQTVYGLLEKHPNLLNKLQSTLPNVFKKLQDFESAKISCKVAEGIVKDWLKESDWAGVVRAQLLESGIVGTGVIKGPFPKDRPISSDVSSILETIPNLADKVTSEVLTRELEAMLFYTPHIECIKVENCYPDPDCGSDIQNGRFFYEEVTDVSVRQLKDMSKDSSYNSEAIKLALEEGPQNKKNKRNSGKKGSYSLWIRTGCIDWKDNNEEYSAGFGVVTLLNGRIIKSAPYSLETQSFPYHVLCWEPRDDSWAGIGIPEQMETPARGLIASVRALMDNLGYSVGPQILMLDNLIEPVDGEDYELRPYKRWKVKSGLPGVDAMEEAKKAMAFLEFPSLLDVIMPVIQFWMKMAEDTTGLSLLLQGQAVTDAVGVSQQLMNNSTTNLRLIVKGWDDKVCKPLMTSYYEWVQLYGPEEAKGDAVVEPLGSSVLVVRELQQQALLQIAQQVIQPIYGLSPSKWMAMYLEGFQIDAEVLALTEEERAKLDEAEKQPDPKILVAQIEAQASVYKADLQQEMERLKLALEAQFKRLSLEQAQEQAQLKSDTDITKQAMTAATQGQNSSGKPVESPSQSAQQADVKAALGALGLQ